MAASSSSGYHDDSGDKAKDLTEGVTATYRESSGDLFAKEQPGDSISDLAWSPMQDVIAAASWDKSVYIWEVIDNQLVAKTSYAFSAPVLSCGFSRDGSRLISSGCDHEVAVRDLQAEQSMVLGRHTAPVKYVSIVDEMNLVVSGSWDKKLCFWSPQQSKPVVKVDLPAKVLAMDVKYPLMAVGLAGSEMLIFDLKQDLETENARSMSTGLKMPTKSVSCFPDKRGFVVGGLKGMCHMMSLEDQSQSFMFRCHQSVETFSPFSCYTRSAVNCLDFHPKLNNCFASVGGDGSFIFWERSHRKLLKRCEVSSGSLTSGKFNSSGELFAYAVSYDWGQGFEAFHKSLPRQLGIHRPGLFDELQPLIEEELRPRKDELQPLVKEEMEEWGERKWCQAVSSLVLLFLLKIIWVYLDKSLNFRQVTIPTDPTDSVGDDPASSSFHVIYLGSSM